MEIDTNKHLEIQNLSKSTMIYLCVIIFAFIINILFQMCLDKNMLWRFTNFAYIWGLYEVIQKLRKFNS